MPAARVKNITITGLKDILDLKEKYSQELLAYEEELCSLIGKIDVLEKNSRQRRSNWTRCPSRLTGSEMISR